MLVLFALCRAARAQTGPRLLLEPFPKEQFISARANAFFFDRGHVQESDDDVRLSIYETEGRVRVQPGNLISPRVGWSFTYFDVDSKIRPAPLPARLVDQSVGVAVPLAKWDEWVLAGSFGVGYAGDSPLGDGNAWYGKGTLLALRQFSDTEALVFVIDYDRNRSYFPDVPLPGVSYTRRLGKELFFIVGLPVSSVTWTPSDQWELEATYTLVERFEASVSYKIGGGLRLFGDLRARTQGFFLDEVQPEYHRLLFEQRTAELGIQWEPRTDVSFTLSGGYAWGQEFSAGFDFRSSREVADLSDEPFLALRLDVRF